MASIRLIYPQWQGAEITRWIPEIKDPAQSARGYYLGAELLQMLAPAGSMPTYTVPVTLEGATSRTVTDGILDKKAILNQTQAALDILRVTEPEKIVTLGGECSASVVPFTYLAQRYGEDLLMVWIDAHPDITLPGDAYPGYHAMALAAVMGLGDADITGLLPGRIEASRIMIAGLRDWERYEIEVRQQTLGLKHIGPEALRENSEPLIEWLRSQKARKVVIHFDMDVLEPKDMIAAVGVIDNGLTLGETVRLINDIAREKELVGLTVAEPMPRTAIRLREMLHHLPLIGE